ncbi:hypothetical protein HanPSC8_Chr05g0188891 [Helianthus annuus]|nr:hypothetical protein HanIR_Chr05g0210861 [Helianthus annuus]KAJ0748958.1 hypothetical protein HanLR1_Chr05g0164351 [Helianthus annuus]KAJ0921210.1 hypothetical protein HanPSC8_Chr05g0188891 [Helianthus annuus]
MKKKKPNREGCGMYIFLVFFSQKHSHSSSLFKRTNSTHNILTKLQFTICFCALLIFVMLLLFTLSFFEPDNSLTTPYSHPTLKPYARALQRLGTLYMQGTTAMNNLVLCHVPEHVTTREFKLFLRAFHTSGLLSDSDLLFLFDSLSTLDSFNSVILLENNLFLKVVHRYEIELCKGNTHFNFTSSVNVTRVKKSKKKVMDRREPIWGGGIKSRLTRVMSYGSVVGFDVGELDPENSLSGLMGQVPMSLRRWASYPMILGRVRRHYEHVMLVDVQKVLLLGDPLGRVKTLSPDSVLLSSTHEKTINPAVIMGGMRGIRRLSSTMLMEIVRTTTTQRHNNKRKILVTESSLLKRLATNVFTLRSIRIVVTSIMEASSLGGSTIANQTIVWREYYYDTDIDSVVMKYICSFSIDSAVYMYSC